VHLAAEHLHRCGGHRDRQGHKSFDEVAAALVAAIDGLLSDPARAAGICGAIANPATQARAEATAAKGRVLRAGASNGEPGPLLLAVSETDTTATEECFGPVAFLIATRDADAAIQQAATLAAEKGAITAALYDTDESRIARAEALFAQAGVNLSINLTGNIFVNQSAAFSDFHVTGANPAGNASLTDTAFVATRFRRVMSRRLAA
jgi:acyl-CoA reductase-like NAD-dependent aldehyde dehydrogenase